MMDVGVYQAMARRGMRLQVHIRGLNIGAANGDISLLHEKAFAALKSRLAFNWEPLLQIKRAEAPRTRKENHRARDGEIADAGDGPPLHRLPGIALSVLPQP
jgi:hypothetical protein